MPLQNLWVFQNSNLNNSNSWSILTVLICEATLYGDAFMNEFFEYIAPDPYPLHPRSIV